jgi:hypothetical protein
LGVFIARYLPFGPVAVLLSVGSTAIVLRLLKSPMAPAFSAGLLPLVLGWTTAGYPPSILFGLICLGLLVQIRQRRLAWTLPPTKRDILSGAEDVTERVASGVLWVPVFFGFVLGVAALATSPDWHVLLFPPLVVMAYEMFAHPKSCPWARRPWSLTLVCTLSAISGVIWVTWCGVGLLATLGALAVGILLLRWFDLHAPPILAVGLLPLILTHPGPVFPMAVAASLLLLNGVFMLYRSGVSYWDGFRRIH